MEDHLTNSVGIVEPHCIRVVSEDSPLELQCGRKLAPIDVTYETYGTLSAAKDNVVMVCHALSGDAHVAGLHFEDDKKPGWWDTMIGPGKAIDTNKYYVICSNTIGGCRGTTGPSSIDPATNKPYGIEFPIITIADMVEVQKRLLDKLGIDKMLAVVGGSMGGMQALQWSIAYPDMVNAAVVAASTTRLGAQSIAFDAVGRNSIIADPNFNGGQYHNGQGPDHGLAIARMIGHITYLSEESMRQKFGRDLRSSDKYNYDFKSEFSVETYLDYQGQRFVERFDANSYLYISKAMDYFDLAQEYGSLRECLKKTSCRFLVMSFSSDWLFTKAQSEDIVHALAAEGKDVSYCNIESPYGHDAFLLEPVTIGDLIEGFLDSTYNPIKQARASSNKSPHEAFDQAKRLRVDYELIESMIEPNSRVLDVGSGDGELLARLTQDKDLKGEGIEVNQNLVVHCIGRGLSVVHRDIERGLCHYPTDSFDYAILSQTVQTLNDPAKVIIELLRVAKKVIVSFPNFGHWKCRLGLLLSGHSPRTKQLPFRWYDSPNKHFFTIKDFDEFCQELNIRVEAKIPLTKTRPSAVKFAPNIFAEQAVYLTSKSETTSNRKQ